MGRDADDSRYLIHVFHLPLKPKKKGNLVLEVTPLCTCQSVSAGRDNFADSLYGPVPYLV